MEVLLCYGYDEDIKKSSIGYYPKWSCPTRICPITGANIIDLNVVKPCNLNGDTSIRFAIILLKDGKEQVLRMLNQQRK